MLHPAPLCSLVKPSILVVSSNLLSWGGGGGREGGAGSTQFKVTLQPGREQEGAGNFPFPIHALGAEHTNRQVTKRVNRPERVG